MSDQPDRAEPTATAVSPYLAPVPPRLGRPVAAVVLAAVFVGIVMTVWLAPSTLRAQSQPAAAPRAGYGFSFALPTVPVQSHFALGDTPKPKAAGGGGSTTVWVIVAVCGALALAGGGTALVVRGRHSRLGV
jgi:hypothetical protein